MKTIKIRNVVSVNRLLVFIILTVASSFWNTPLAKADSEEVLISWVEPLTQFVRLVRYTIGNPAIDATSAAVKSLQNPNKKEIRDVTIVNAESLVFSQKSPGEVIKAEFDPNSLVFNPTTSSLVTATEIEAVASGSVGYSVSAPDTATGRKVAIVGGTVHTITGDNKEPEDVEIIGPNTLRTILRNSDTPGTAQTVADINLGVGQTPILTTAAADGHTFLFLATHPVTGDIYLANAKSTALSAGVLNKWDGSTLTTPLSVPGIRGMGGVTIGNDWYLFFAQALDPLLNAGSYGKISYLIFDSSGAPVGGPTVAVGKLPGEPRGMDPYVQAIPELPINVLGYLVFFLSSMIFWLRKNSLQDTP